MPDRFFLNALEPKTRTLQVPEGGKWKGDVASKDFLTHYAADIHLEGEVSDPHVAHSVPSVFARPIQFYQALGNEKSPLHKTMASQWRGLLATFALQKWLPLTLTAKEYIVEPVGTPASEEAGVGGVGDQHLRIILSNQLPYPPSDWERWWLLYCDDHLIGATSPWTVVYTPAEYTCPGSIHWQDDSGLLVDPISYFGRGRTGKSEELGLLLRWVELLLERHRLNNKWGIADRLEDKTAAIKRQLEAWKSDLERYRDRALLVQSLEEFPLVSEAPYCHFFLAPHRGDQPPLLPSDLILDTSKKDTKTLVLSRSGLDQRKRVYGSVFVDQVDLTALQGPTGKSDWSAKNGRAVPLPYIIAEEAFLPPKLAEINLSENALALGTNKYAIPLSPLFFKYFNHSDLKNREEMLTLSETPERVVVRLRLPLAGKGTGVLAVEKTYERDTQIVRFAELGGTPALAVWPDFYSEGWLDNFAVYSTSRDSKLAVAPLLGDGGDLSRTVEDGSQKPLRIWQSRKPPIGFALYYREPGSGELIPVGLALRKTLQPPETLNPDRTWTVAVDFGTSSTHVKVKRTGTGHEPLPLQGRTITLSAAAEGFEEVAVLSLYPTETVVPPFVTLVARGNATMIPESEGGVPKTAEFTPWFLFYPYQGRGAETFFENVKWGPRGGTTEDAPLREYLRSVVRYIAGEAFAAGVGNLSFEWSHPLALPRGARGAMASFWQAVATSFSTPKGMTITAGEGFSESDALCRYLAAITPRLLPVHSEALSIAVDVGGGTSDIGFWSEATLLDQVSLKLAGNDLLEPLVALEGLVPRLYKICTGDELPSALWPAFQKRPGVMFNALLSQAKDRSGQPYGSRDPRNHPVVAALFGGDLPHGTPPWSVARSLIYLFFSGLAFYLGLHARKLVTNMREINLYIGGRGSSLLPWIAADNRKTAEVISYAFEKGLLRDASGSRGINKIFGPAINYAVSFPPKEEVASGLLSPPLGRGGGGRYAPKETTILGEIGWATVDGTPLNWDVELTADQIYSLRPPPNFDSGYVATFLEDVLPKHFPDLNLDQERLKQLKVEPPQVQDYMRGSASGEQTILQPVFAWELKALMEQYLPARPK